jgi:hypothetical protein
MTTFKEFVDSKTYFDRTELRAAFNGDDPDSWGMGEQDIPPDVLGYIRFMYEGYPIFCAVTENEYQYEFNDHGWVQEKNQAGLDFMMVTIYTVISNDTD